MSWVVVDPGKVTTKQTRVIRVDVPSFTDEIPYEDILGRHLTDPSSLEWMAAGGCVVLVTGEAYEDLDFIMNSILVGPVTVLEELRQMCLARKAVCLRFAS